MRALFAAAALLAPALFCERAEASPNLDKWVAANTSPTARTACARQVDDELFFVAIAADDRVRLANRVFVYSQVRKAGKEPQFRPVETMNNT